MILAAMAGLVVAAQAQAVGPIDTPPSAAATQRTPGVTVTAHRIPHSDQVVVTGAPTCPAPDPRRYATGRDPAVVDSYPRPGATVRPGLIQVRITFDAPMSCYADVTTQGGDVDPCQAQGAWVLPSRRSFLTFCRLQPGASYTLRFARVHDHGFVGMSGRSAEPFALRFSADRGPPVTQWPQAQRADPGPPGDRSSDAYVTCTGTADVGPNGDCKRQRFSSPGPR